MNFKRILALMLCGILINVVPSVFAMDAEEISESSKQVYQEFPFMTSAEQIDPLVDLELTVEINTIRAFDRIDRYSDPDFYVKVFINDREFQSPVWRNQKYLENIDWSVTTDVPDFDENVSVTIQLWDWNPGLDRMCDISADSQEGRVKEINLLYNLRFGHWFGDDFTDDEPTWADPSGYGRANGCDDGSYDREDRDCEVYFNIYQNDYDGDSLPYWVETNVYYTNPEVDDTGLDSDNDGVPIEWEHHWGWYASWWGFGLMYNATAWEDHHNLDPDNDGLDNYEEYLTSQWGSDPFRRDLFLEVDQMEPGPNGEGHLIPELSKIIWREPFNRRNIVFHLDDGCLGGGDILSFDESTSNAELRQYYLNNFCKGDPNYWRRGVFHYGLVIYRSEDYPGFVFNGGQGPFLDSFQISTRAHDNIAETKILYCYLRYGTFNQDLKRTRVYAGAMMHELGHTLGIFGGNTPGCDDQDGKFPYQIDFWRWRNYKSVMNYRYVYGGLDNKVDYSDGSNGRNDFDDWARLDLGFFQRPLW